MSRTHSPPKYRGCKRLSDQGIRGRRRLSVRKRDAVKVSEANIIALIFCGTLNDPLGVYPAKRIERGERLSHLHALGDVLDYDRRR